MKILLALFFLLMVSLGGCDNEKYTPIAKFEEVLGKKNSETLTYLIDDFENNFLPKEYPELTTKKAYQKFVEEIKIGKNDFSEKISESAKQKFVESQLINEIYTFVDSVWFEREFVNTRHIYKSETGTIIVGTRQSFKRGNQNRDSLVNYFSNSVDFNFRGKFMRALESIKDENSFLTEYYEVKDKVGSISNEMLPYHLERHKIDYSNYFVKRILVLELIYI